jgi:hypothetical protein
LLVHGTRVFPAATPPPRESTRLAARNLRKLRCLQFAQESSVQLMFGAAGLGGPALSSSCDVDFRIDPRGARAAWRRSCCTSASRNDGFRTGRRLCLAMRSKRLHRRAFPLPTAKPLREAAIVFARYLLRHFLEARPDLRVQRRRADFRFGSRLRPAGLTFLPQFSVVSGHWKRVRLTPAPMEPKVS